jgi:hypothetical protein
MTTKLTLTVEEDVIKRAKHYAKNTGRSLSEIIENYLDSLTEKNTDKTPSTKLSKIIGVVKLPEDFDEKAELDEYYRQKHL